MSQMEIRASMDDVKALDEDNQMIIEGYAVVFDSPSIPLQDKNGRKFIETISKRALDDVDLSRVFALYQHDYKNVVARSDAGNLTLLVDEIGLKFRAVLPNTSIGRDVYENIKVGNIRSCSFGWVGTEDSWSKRSDGLFDRTINKFNKLKEITFTPVPAYESSFVEATRSLENFEQETAVKEELVKLSIELEKEKILWGLDV